MENDIIERIIKDFGTETEKAINLLEKFEVNFDSSPRLSRCIVHLANGNITKLEKTIQDAKEDWRDVIIAAESTNFEFKNPFK